MRHHPSSVTRRGLERAPPRARSSTSDATSPQTGASGAPGPPLLSRGNPGRSETRQTSSVHAATVGGRALQRLHARAATVASQTRVHPPSRVRRLRLRGNDCVRAATIGTSARAVRAATVGCAGCNDLHVVRPATVGAWLAASTTSIDAMPMSAAAWARALRARASGAFVRASRCSGRRDATASHRAALRDGGAF